MSEKLFKKFQSDAEAWNEKANTKDVAEVIAAMISAWKKFKEELTERFSDAKTGLDDDLKAEMRKAGKMIDDVERRCMKMMEKIGDEKDKALMQEVRKLMDEISEVRGMIPEETDLADVYKTIETVKGLIPKETDLSEVFEKLDELTDKFKDYDKRLQQTSPRGIVLGGARGVQLYTDGTKRGQAQMINLIPGSGVTLSYAYSHGRNDITISASGSGASILTATGSINGSNTDFVFASKPNIVIVNGASYRENSGWSWTEGTLTATLDFAPQSGNDVYGLG